MAEDRHVLALWQGSGSLEAASVLLVRWVTGTRSAVLYHVPSLVHCRGAANACLATCNFLLSFSGHGLLMVGSVRVCECVREVDVLCCLFPFRFFFSEQSFSTGSFCSF